MFKNNSHASGSAGINRNIVECKAGHGAQMQRNELAVLIETSWNVKSREVAAQARDLEY